MLPGLKLGRKSPQEVEADAIEKLRLHGIESEAKKLANRLSGGQKQRVAIARALINDPLIIMGDEQTVNLDSKNADNVYGIFRELSQEKGLSLLIVTHDIDFANRTDRIISMEDGRIISAYTRFRSWLICNADHTAMTFGWLTSSKVLSNESRTIRTLR